MSGRSRLSHLCLVLLNQAGSRLLRTSYRLAGGEQFDVAVYPPHPDSSHQLACPSKSVTGLFFRVIFQSFSGLVGAGGNAV